MKKGDICIVNLDIHAGHEQYGARPAIFISDTKTNIAIIIPLTTNIYALKFPHTLKLIPDKNNNLEKESVVLVFHLKSVDKLRIGKIIGKINKNIQLL